MVQRVNGLVGALIAESLMLGSTAAEASAPALASPDPWAVLSVMSGGTPAAAMCGAAVAAAATQSPTGCVLPALDAAPPPAQAAPPRSRPPPISAPSAGLGINPMLLGLLALAPGIGLYFAVHHHGNSPT
jgi:hypothetical protein